MEGPFDERFKVAIVLVRMLSKFALVKDVSFRYLTLRGVAELQRVRRLNPRPRLASAVAKPSTQLRGNLTPSLAPFHIIEVFMPAI